MADRYPEARYVMASTHGEGTPLQVGSDCEDAYRREELPGDGYELVSVSDMDALRALVVCAMKWRNDEPLSRSEFLAAFDAIPPSFLATVEKP